MSAHAQNIRKSAQKIKARMGRFSPKIAVLLGSGLGGIADTVAKPLFRISYKDLPGFPLLTVAGHAGEIVGGRIGKNDVLFLKGRQHFYETDDATPLKTLIRTMKALGVETLFLTAASGSLMAKARPGSLMVISDHINYMGFNPLVGRNDDDFGPRFFSLTDAWDPALRQKLKMAAKKSKITLHEGVYIAFRGPSFESPAEIKMAIKMGAQAVGMSTVPDCIIARHCGLKAMGVSVMTNMGAGLSREKLDHEHTMKNASKAVGNFEKLLKRFLG